MMTGEPAETATPDPAWLGALIRAAARSLVYTSEAQLQGGLARMFTSEQIRAVPQVRLGPYERPDFMVGSIAVELKTAGTAAQLIRQITRYAAHDRVTAIVVVTSRARHRCVPSEINGKPVVVAWLSGLLA